MIKEVLQQLEPLDAQIDALCSSTDDAEMANTTTHAAELAELSAQENMLLQRCTSLTPEDRVFLARRPDRPLYPPGRRGREVYLLHAPGL